MSDTNRPDMQQYIGRACALAVVRVIALRKRRTLSGWTPSKEEVAQMAIDARRSAFDLVKPKPETTPREDDNVRAIVEHAVRQAFAFHYRKGPL